MLKAADDSLGKTDTARIPGSDDELRLMRRGKEFSIMLGTNELMNSRLSGSEAALATLAAKKIEKVAEPHLLIGGLGMGFTLVPRSPCSEAKRRSWWLNWCPQSSPGRGVRWRKFLATA